MLKANYISISLAFFILSNASFAQKKRGLKTKKSNLAWEIQLGASNMLSDLGGADKIGSNNINDLNTEATRYHSSFGIVFNSKAFFSAKLAGTYTHLHGSDAYTQNEARRIRNISVNTHLFSVSLLPELRMPLSARGAFGSGSFIGVTAGVGALYFIPKANYNGKSYNLHSLQTEGQGASLDRKAYRQFALDIPFGINYRYYVDKYKSLGIELMAHKSFTDYLDDVSTTYYDNDIIRLNNGEAAAQLADPNTTGIKRPQGEKRGNANKNDNFFTVSLVFRYTLHSKRLF